MLQVLEVATSTELRTIEPTALALPVRASESYMFAVHFEQHLSRIAM